MIKNIFLFSMLIIVLSSGCSQQLTTNESSVYTSPDSFKVKYYARYSSGGGDRILDIIYTVENGEIVSCDGTYTTAMTDGTTVGDCEVESLKKKDHYTYNVPLELITTISEDQEMQGEGRDGPSFYSWEIMLD